MIKMQEPTILLVGRLMEVMEVQKDELKRYGREVNSANSVELIDQVLGNTRVDLVVIGAGLPDEEREKMRNHIKTIAPDLPVFVIERNEKSSPYEMVAFTNEKAFEFKLNKVFATINAQD